MFKYIRAKYWAKKHGDEYLIDILTLLNKNCFIDLPKNIPPFKINENEFIKDIKKSLIVIGYDLEVKIEIGKISSFISFYRNNLVIDIINFNNYNYSYILKLLNGHRLVVNLTHTNLLAIELLNEAIKLKGDTVGISPHRTLPAPPPMPLSPPPLRIVIEDSKIRNNK